MKTTGRILCFLMCGLMFVPPVAGQMRSGAAFLTVLPGARLQAMASSHTAEIDEPFAIFANPGVAGFYREWQMSTTYSKWIADVYHASMLYGRSIKTPWSQRTRVAVGLFYQGMPSFDSTDGKVEHATANDWLASLSLGQPLTFLTPKLSVGASVKVFKSSLDTYSAQSVLADLGFSYKSQRFGLGNSLFPVGLFSLGASVNHLGSDLTYDRMATPLPRTWRTGIAFYAGRHNGLQMRLTADYREILDRGGEVGVGADLSWSRRFSFFGGYQFQSDLFEKYSIGMSIRLDDVMTDGVLPGRNKALQLDMGSLNEQDFFSRTYRGTLSYYPIGPEAFECTTPERADTVMATRAILEWQESRDPDLFDSIQYTVILDQDSSDVAMWLEGMTDGSEMLAWMADEKLDYMRQNLKGTQSSVDSLKGGWYYWAVVAHDQDNHIRFAEQEGCPIAKFYVPRPDVEIESIEFDYTPWITEDDFHGTLQITFRNKGDRDVSDLELFVTDSYLDSTFEQHATDLSTVEIPVLAAGDSQLVSIPWHTDMLGEHDILVMADHPEQWREANVENNRKTRSFYTVPKGRFVTRDTVTTLYVSRVSIDMPIITQISFDTNSAVVKKEYVEKTVIDPPLVILANRLKKNPFLKIALQGYADPNSESATIELANRRAHAIRDTLVQMGVDNRQIEMFSGQILEERNLPQNRTDRTWILQERRYDDISTDPQGQAVLFLPVRHTDREYLFRPVPFFSDIKHALSLDSTDLVFHVEDMEQRRALKRFPINQRDSLRIEWRQKLDSPWVNSAVSYELAIVDSLGRTFRTHPERCVMEAKDYLRQHRIAFPLKFAQTDPLYRFYWARLFVQVEEMLRDPHMKFRFTGHACKVGPEDVNERLSRRRAMRFHEGFLRYVRENHPARYAEIEHRIEPARGYGEARPLSVERLSGETILIGDNDKPLGRKLNRRIEIEFYSSVAPWEQAEEGAQ